MSEDKNEVLEEVIPIETDKGDNNRCPDFDEDCKCIKNHLDCYLGWWGIGTAKGYCPFIHGEN